MFPPPRPGPGLALLASTHAVLAAAMAFLAGHRGCGRRFYVQHREALTLLYCLHMQWTVRLTGEQGGAVGRRGCAAPRVPCPSWQLRAAVLRGGASQL